MVRYEKIMSEQKSPVKFLRFLDYNRFDPAIDPHWHNSIEIIVCVVGQFDMWDGGVRYHLEPGEIHIINTRSIHSFYEVYEDENVYSYAIQIKYDFIKEIMSDIDEYYFISPTSDHNQEFLDLIYQLDYAFRQSGNFAYIKEQALILEILYYMFEHLSQKREKQSLLKSKKNTKKLKEIISYIDEHYFEELSVENIAHEFQYDRSYLSRFFKENMGVTLKEYIVSICLNHAYEDLIRTDLTIVDIAYQNGFPNEHAFSQAFKAKYKLTPKKFRKNVTK